MEERLHRLVRAQHLGAEARDAALARRLGERRHEELAEPAALHVVDDGHGRLGGSGLVLETDEARDAHPLGVGGVRGHGLGADRDVVPAVDVEEAV